MGMSDITIHDITSMTQAWKRCPSCTHELAVCEVDMQALDKVYFCPNPDCKLTFFDIDDNFMADEKMQQKARDMFVQMISSKVETCWYSLSDKKCRRSNEYPQHCKHRRLTEDGSGICKFNIKKLNEKPEA